MDFSPSEHILLKELGIREVPELNELIAQIIEKHPSSPTIVEQYPVSDALTYMVTRFHQHYRKWWSVTNSQQAFLPCYRWRRIFEHNDSTSGSTVFLAAPNSVFTGSFFHSWSSLSLANLETV
jgi:hypothetical protein